jgi:hypothetical protein
MTSKRAEIRHLREQNQRLTIALGEAEDLAKQSFERQILVACLLEKLSDGGAVILPVELRQRALKESWGYTTEIVTAVPEKPMIVTILKSKIKPKLKRKP